jgi:hypothetical protein
MASIGTMIPAGGLAEGARSAPSGRGGNADADLPGAAGDNALDGTPA